MHVEKTRCNSLEIRGHALMLKMSLGLLIAALPLLAKAVEEPSYDVVQKLDGAEIRQYAPYVVAQVLVSGPADQAGNQAFPILAG
ncbi:MAG: heme-binding protein, partial [Caldimonas sp.]